MHLVNLPYNKLEELLPYIDTLIVPIGSFGIPSNEDLPIGNDLLQVRKIADGIEQQLAGRVFLLPEVMVTNFELSASYGISSPILGNYLYEMLLSFKEAGFERIVLLYRNEALTETVEATASRLLQAGFRVLAHSIQEGTGEADTGSITKQAIQTVIGLWQS